MYAVIKTGGKQYRVAADDIIEIEKLAAEVGETVAFPDVLMVAGSGAPEIGRPTVAGATVAGEIVEQTRGDKVISFKKRRRKNSRRKRGHRQQLTVVRITEILTGGSKPSKLAKVLAAADSKQGSQAAHGRSGAAFIARQGLSLASIGGTGAAGSATAGAGAGKGNTAAASAAARTPGTKAKGSAGSNGTAAQGGPGKGAGRAFGLLSTPEGKADDLTLIGGIGDKIAGTLNRHGIHHFWQIAAMTDKDIADVERDLEFPGRIKREEWREQARELMAGKAPRAKVDRVHKDGQS